MTKTVAISVVATLVVLALINRVGALSMVKDAVQGA